MIREVIRKSHDPDHFWKNDSWSVNFSKVLWFDDPVNANHFERNDPIRDSNHNFHELPIPGVGYYNKR